MKSGVANVILGALRQGPKSGYDIKQLVDGATRFFWAASYGQLYPELRRLVGDGLIEGTSRPRGGRQRTEYRLTPAGRDALHAWLRESEAGYEMRNEGLLKLFFAGALKGDEALDVVRAFRIDREGVLEQLREVQRTNAKAPRGFPGLALEYGIGLHEWIVGWCLEIEERLIRQPGVAER